MHHDGEHMRRATAVAVVGVLAAGAVGVANLSTSAFADLLGTSTRDVACDEASAVAAASERVDEAQAKAMRRFQELVDSGLAEPVELSISFVEKQQPEALDVAGLAPKVSRVTLELPYVDGTTLKADFGIRTDLPLREAVRARLPRLVRMYDAELAELASNNDAEDVAKLTGARADLLAGTIDIAAVQATGSPSDINAALDRLPGGPYAVSLNALVPALLPADEASRKRELTPCG